MKIIGFTYQNSKKELIMKGDSALLVNRKPFFIPDCTKRMAGFPVLALRVCKLGKNISAKFAHRYVDAVAPAIDLQAMDMREAASQAGDSWTTAVSLDGSFPVGDFTAIDQTDSLRIVYNEKIVAETGRIEVPAEAIAEISRYITIRQGDIIYIPFASAPIFLNPEDQFLGFVNEQEQLFCRIK